ncbi:MAG: DUF1566 domain-containing protein [Methylococcaceae bacterium]
MFKHPVRAFIYAVFMSYSIASVAASISPNVIQLVEVSSLEKGTLAVSWLPTSDDNTLHQDLVYRVYLSEQADFLPDNTTLKLEKTGAMSANISGLKPATAYFVVVTATDKDGNVSWSNRLEGKTTAFNPKRTAVPVHELSAGQFAKSAKQFKTGDYIVNRENEGTLRKIDAATRSSQATPANHGSLNELFNELAISSTIKMQDLPEQLPGTAQAQAKFTANQQGTSVTWTDTGLTLSSSEPSANNRSAKKPIINGDKQTETGKYATLSAPAYLGIEPKQAKQWTVQITLGNSNMELCKTTNTTTHPDATKNSLPKPTATLDKAKGLVTLNWTPTDNHVDLSGRPYTTTVTAYIDAKGDGCNGDNTFGYWSEKVEIAMPVYVTKGAPNDTVKDKLISFNGGFKIDNKFSYDIRPELFIGASISGGSLKSAYLKAKADLSFNNKLTITSTGKATLKQRVPVLAEKKFIKVFVAGGVPIVVSGKFKVDADIVGNVSGKATLEKLLALKFPDTEFGLEYRNGVWQVVQKMNPSYTFQIKGEADASADVTLTLIPDMQVSFYDAATGRLIVEPYVYAQAGLHGQFKYLNANGAPLTDLDYWFTDLQAGAGANLKLYAGLSIFDYNIASYPKNTSVDQIAKFKQVTLLAKTPLAKLPSLSIAVNDAPTLADNSDSRQMYLQGQAKNYVAPFNIALVKFADWTPPTLLTTATGAALNGTKGGYWFTYSKPGTYTVRLAGNSNLGWFIRQIAETTITLTDNDNDGMVDQWESRYGITDPNADDDGDGVSNLAEFNSGYQPNNANHTPFVVAGAAGDKQVMLTWNALTAATNYGVCYATETIADINNCLNYADGTWQDVSNTTLTIAPLSNGKQYYFRVLAENVGSTLGVSNTITVTPGELAALNDTGINSEQCYQQDSNTLVACTSVAANNLSNSQDGMVGRDVSANTDSDGHAGFSFTKISNAGEALPVTADSWACVQDNVTGLMWENKTADGGLHDGNNNYTNYSADYGAGNLGAATDASGFVATVNQQNLCGAGNWRLPTADELQSIVDYSIAYPGPTIDTAFFPSTQQNAFWSSSPYVGYSNGAWNVYFSNGYVNFSYRGYSLPVRLVRASQ